MLRCTLSGLIPLMMSGKYAGYAESFYEAETQHFQAVIRHKSYYLLRRLPVSISERLILPELPSLLSSQKKNGMWKVKETERITYDILAALKYTGLFDNLYSNGSLKYSPLDYVRDRYDFYSLLIKSKIYQKNNDKDIYAKTVVTAEILNKQKDNGSWDDTVTSTVVNIESLMDMDIEKDNSSVLRGVEFLFRNLNEKLDGIHTTAPYGLQAGNMFTTKDRIKEFTSADKLKPEWIPRKLCFRTMAIIPDTVCLVLLIRLGMENDKRVESALDNIYHLYNEYGGLCASNIKQPFL